MSHTFLLPCGKLDGQPPGGSVKHTVVSGIFGFITAVVAVLTVDFLRQRVLLALKTNRAAAASAVCSAEAGLQTSSGHQSLSG